MTYPRIFSVIVFGAIDPLNAELNPICQLLALLGAHPILHVSRIRVKQQSCFLSSHVTLQSFVRQAQTVAVLTFWHQNYFFNFSTPCI